MKAEKWIGFGLIITILTVVAGLLVLRIVSGVRFWHNPMMGSPGMRRLSKNTEAPLNTAPKLGQGVLGDAQINQQCNFRTDSSTYTFSAEFSDNCVSGTEEQPVACPGHIILPPDFENEHPTAIYKAHLQFEKYLTDMKLDGLIIGDIMEFEDSYYATVIEEETGMGAMELLIDNNQGIVTPEIGPNMMWNGKYGMEGRGMMRNRTNTAYKISEHEAAEIAQDWLEENMPGETIEQTAYRFYGYYTLHILDDVTVSGILSVHAITGQIWHHSWHGDYLDMLVINDFPYRNTNPK